MRFRARILTASALLTAVLAVDGQAQNLAQEAAQKMGVPLPAIKPARIPPAAVTPKPAAPVQRQPAAPAMPPAAAIAPAAPPAAPATPPAAPVQAAPASGPNPLALAMMPVELPPETVDNAAYPLLNYVPKNTLYMMGSSRPLPEAFMNNQIEIAGQLFTMFLELVEKEEGELKRPPQGTVDAFAYEMVMEFKGALSPEKFSDLGLSTSSRGVLYGHGLLPVMRIELPDPAKFRATIKRVEERSGYKVAWEKCGSLDCMKFTEPSSSDGGALLVMHPNHVAMGVYLGPEPGPMGSHLTGETKVPAPMSYASLQQFIAENGYTGYGEGFIKLREAMDVIEPLAIGMMKMQGQTADADMAKKCMAVATSVLDNVPELIIGTRAIEGKRANVEMLMKMDKELAAVMKTLPASLDKMPVSQNPVFDLGLSLNIPAVRDNLLAFMTWLGEQGKSSGCEAIEADKLNEASVGIAMAMGMGLTQVKSVYFALNDIELDPATMQPSKLDARASVVADDPVGLVRMASMLAPPLAQMKMPKDGETITLGPDTLPPGTPPLTVGLDGKRLDVAIAGSSAASKMLPADKQALLWSTMDGPRYYEVFANLAKMAPPSPDRPDAELGIELIEKMGKFQPSMTQTIYPDDRGLVFDLDITYQ